MDSRMKEIAKVMKEFPEDWVEKLVEMGITNSVRRTNGVVIYMGSDAVAELLEEGKVAASPAEGVQYVVL